MTTLRETVLKRHHLAAAFRLPSVRPGGGAALFPGAMLVTDLLFFRARGGELDAVDAADRGLLAGRYFEEFPGHVLGRELGKDAGDDDQTAKPRFGYQVEGEFTRLPALVERPVCGACKVLTFPVRPTVGPGRVGVSRQVVDETAYLSPDLAAAVSTGLRVDRYLALVTGDIGDEAGMLWSELHDALRAWAGTHGNPHAHVGLVKLARAHVTGAERFLAAFDKAGTLIAGLSKAPAVPEPRFTGRVDDVTAQAELLFRAHRALTPSELHTFHRSLGGALPEEQVVRTVLDAGWCLDGATFDQLVPPDVYYTGALWPRFDRVRPFLEGAAHPFAAALAAQARKLQEVIAPALFDDIEGVSARQGWLPLPRRGLDQRHVRPELGVRRGRARPRPGARGAEGLGLRRPVPEGARPAPRGPAARRVDEPRQDAAAAPPPGRRRPAGAREPRRPARVRRGRRQDLHRPRAPRARPPGGLGPAPGDPRPQQHRVEVGGGHRARAARLPRRGDRLQTKTISRGPARAAQTSEVDTPAERAAKWTRFQAGEFDVVLLTYTSLARTRMSEGAVRAYAEPPRRSSVRWPSASATPRAEEALRARGGHPQAKASAAGSPRSWSSPRTGSTTRHRWDDLGVDLLIVDEAQNFKNLYLPEDREGGVPRFMGNPGDGSQARLAARLPLRGRAPQDRRGGRRPALGDPGEEQPARALQPHPVRRPDAWSRMGIRDPEQFIDRYLKIEIKPVVTPQMEVVERGAVVGFQNLHELRDVIFRYAEFKTAEEVGLGSPSRRSRWSRSTWTPRRTPSTTATSARSRRRSKSTTRRTRRRSSGCSRAWRSSRCTPSSTRATAGRTAGRCATRTVPKFDALAERVLANRTCGHIVFVDNVAAHRWVRDVLVKAGIPEDRIAVLNAEVGPGRRRPPAHRPRVQRRRRRGCSRSTTW
jgi:hypothetical protein